MVPLVEAFLEHNCAVFSINPKQLDRFRDRHTVAGAKDDRRDAFVAADSLRTDQHCFRRVAADHPAILRIRELSRTEDALGCDFRRVANQLHQLLLRYYPQLLQLCSTPDEAWVWALLELAPTPLRGAQLTRARLRKLLAKHHIRRWNAEQVAEVLASPPLLLAPGSAEAITEHVLLLIPQLRLLSMQRKQVADRIQQLLDEMAKCDVKQPESQTPSDVFLRSEHGARRQHLRWRVLSIRIRLGRSSVTTAHAPTWWRTFSIGMPSSSLTLGVTAPRAVISSPGPAIVSTDLAVLKNIRVFEQQSFQFRAEFFNLFNNVNFNNPVATLSSTTYGRITGAQPGRLIQLGLKYIW